MGRASQGREREQEPWLRIISLVAAVPYLVRLGVETLTPLHPRRGVTNNVVPLRTIRDQVDAVALSVAVRQIGGNVVLLVPLGLLLGVLDLRASKAAAIVVATSVGIELLQGWVITGRSADVDDVLLNVVGGLLGWASVAALRHAQGRWRQHPDRRTGRLG